MIKEKGAKKKINAKSKKKLEQARGAWCFWVHYGPVLGNLRDLEKALETMSEEQFRYHANKGKNDFAKWVKDVLRDDDLAKKLQDAKTRKSACVTISGHLKKNYE